MTTTLRVLLAILGLSAIAIAASIMLAGATATTLNAEHVFAALTGYAGPRTPPWPAAMDSELRFYAALFGAFGVLCVVAARSRDAARRLTPWLAAVLFIGGIGRALSYVAVGPPHPMFVTLMAIELGLPPLLLVLWRAGHATTSKSRVN
jgi:hypothetical protein